MSELKMSKKLNLISICGEDLAQYFDGKLNSDINILNSEN